MLTDEAELRRNLAAIAAEASAPRFTTADVAVRVRRLRRRRARIAAGAAGAAGAVLAAAVAIPLGLGGTAPRGQPPRAVSRPAPSISPPAWTVTVNGLTVSRGRAEPQFGVARGEHLTLVITVTVTAHDQLAKLFLGITGNTSGIGPGGPIGMKPVLAAAERLGPGKYAFTADWTVPMGTEPANGYRLAMAAYWHDGTRNESVAAETPMVIFVAGP